LGKKPQFGDKRDNQAFILCRVEFLLSPIHRIPSNEALILSDAMKGEVLLSLIFEEKNDIFDSVVAFLPLGIQALPDSFGKTIHAVEKPDLELKGQSNFEEWIEIAKKMQSEGKPEEVIVALTQALFTAQSQDQRRYALLARAMESIRSGKFEHCLRDALLVEEHANNLKYYLLLANCFHKLSRQWNAHTDLSTFLAMQSLTAYQSVFPLDPARGKKLPYYYRGIFISLYDTS
jgi:hypothetical protein